MTPTRLLGYRAYFELEVEGRTLDVTSALRPGVGGSLIVDLQHVRRLVNDDRVTHPPPPPSPFATIESVAVLDTASDEELIAAEAARRAALPLDVRTLVESVDERVMHAAIFGTQR